MTGTDAQTKEPSAPEQLWQHEALRDILKTIAIALVLALGVRTFIFQPFMIPSPSMEGTLLVGDYLFVSKYSYGFSRYSFPFSSLLPDFGRIFSREPVPGDVVVFRFPPDPNQVYIKRLVGLPGDRIQVVKSVLHINGRPVQVSRDGAQDVTCRPGLRTVPAYRETFPNGASHLIYQCDPMSELDDTQEYVVPDGHYFVLGDNRDNSKDSRLPSIMWGVGFVPRENLIGRAQIVFFSTDGSASLWQVWRWPSAIRFGRLFHAIR